MPGRTALALSLFVASTAFAADERIAVVGNHPAVAQLREGLCISEQCVGAHEKVVATITAKEKKGGLEVMLHDADGSLGYSKLLPLADDGRLSVTDLVSAQAGIVHAIEYPAEAASKPEKKSSGTKVASAAKKHHKSKKLASRKQKTPARG